MLKNKGINFIFIILIIRCSHFFCILFFSQWGFACLFSCKDIIGSSVTLSLGTDMHKGMHKVKETRIASFIPPEQLDQQASPTFGKKIKRLSGYEFAL